MGKQKRCSRVSTGSPQGDKFVSVPIFSFVHLSLNDIYEPNNGVSWYSLGKRYNEPLRICPEFAPMSGVKRTGPCNHHLHASTTKYPLMLLCEESLRQSNRKISRRRRRMHQLFSATTSATTTYFQIPNTLLVASPVSVNN